MKTNRWMRNARKPRATLTIEGSVERIQCSVMELPYRFVDNMGRAFDQYDFTVGPDRRRRGVPLNDRSAEARAFVPRDGGRSLPR